MDDMKIPKNQQKHLLDLVSEYSKVVGYKVSVRNSIAFLYDTSELLEFQISKRNSIYNSTRINEILRYKANKICPEPTWRKLENTNEKK